ncbi:MAG TPA: hypothetical protein VGD35_05370 [Chitinophaga sp.]
MDFNFRDSFQSYSNVELLKIIDEADKYQPEAVEAARHILGGREIHDKDYEQANSFKAVRKEEVKPGEESLSDFLESVMEQATDPKVIRVVNIVYIILTLQYVWMLLSLVKPLDEFQQCVKCTVWSVQFLATVFPAVYLPVAVFLMLKRRPLGWFLLVGFFMVTTVIQLINIFFYVYNWNLYGRADYPYLAGRVIFMLVRVGLVLALYQPVVAAYFKVSERGKRNTLIVAACIGLMALAVNALSVIFG